jgi:cbb3-type cytochrome oxidase cytochrome c subunit
MKNLQILAATAAFAATAALAQPTDVPKAACEPKPSYPGLKAMKSDVEVKAFENSMKTYKECVVKYISDRKTSAKQHQEAENAAAKEYNDVMGKIRADQEAALKEQEAAKASEKKNEPTSPSGKAKSY